MTTIRYFAAAADAVGFPEEKVTSETFTTVKDVRDYALSAHPHAANVLDQCAIFANNTQVTDFSMPAEKAESVDFLPPFAGG
ncbi:MoaD/ThiS family protein [Corynebacterium pyruviciproducens]|uniref:Molybdopterin converting factor, subunit 1 n=1 Tax=Corynebacterium pyruviciproducens ATCC BAA-1742 TaxID=1125779 RepID=S2Z9I2_9CORY|nr:MoaD/ThiS family protein [Corynebacterium pyruviciproducens]EPD71025.1 hypothetical protein HMPREF1219_00321 [Corynebacterium pyruviciproducens ATCC BAA-1742]MDK6565033.1 MoaD/ThiS family protein [Corynebacterium pyruviciproducens]MDK7213877.1 MoaD/ThiS family protein [Corynebacterium pyruviciproducens]